MEYQIIEASEAPLEVQEWLDEKKGEEKYTIINSDVNTYLVVTMGEKSTGGYDIEVSEIIETEEKIIIKVKYLAPSKDHFTIQAITYPYIIVKMNLITKEIEVLIEKDN